MNLQYIQHKIKTLYLELNPKEGHRNKTPPMVE